MSARSKRPGDRFRLRRWPCPACGEQKNPIPTDIPRICKACRLDADMLKLGIDTLSRMPNRDDLPFEWLRGVLAARRILSVASGNGPCGPELRPDVSEVIRA